MLPIPRTDRFLYFSNFLVFLSPLERKKIINKSTKILKENLFSNVYQKYWLIDVWLGSFIHLGHFSFFSPWQMEKTKIFEK